MIIDGEKFACEACVRGHRVSNCQHTDRPLQHINKKGRPVSQCAHCRQMRKSRSAHIKCDCGEKTSKCTHLQPTVEGHTETCCCNHGGRCTCCHKKESSLDTVPESDSEHESQAVLGGRSKPSGRRRRANTIHADGGGLTFDQNGHHPPAGKHNRAGQKCNPYQLNRVHSTTNATSLAHSAGDGPLFPSEQQRRVKSEATSPLMSSSGFGRVDGLPQLDLSSIDYAPYRSSSSFDLFGSVGDHDGPMYSAGLSATSVDWSHYDLDKSHDGFAPSSYSQTGTQSVNGMFEFGSGSEHLPALANTTSTSGNVSEVEDFMSGGDADADSFGGGSFINRDLTSSTDLESFYKATEVANMMDSAVSLVEEDPAFWVPNYKNNGATILDEANDPLSASTMNSIWEL